MANSILPNPVPTLKQCKKCGESKPLEHFHITRQCRYGRASNCKICVNAHVRAYNETNRENISLKRRTLYATNVENAKKCKDRGLRYRNADRDKYNRQVRQWRIANREKYLQSNRNWQLANPAKYRASIDKWEKENAEKMLEVQRKAAHRRRLRLEAVWCDFTFEQWEQIKAFYGNRCAFCHEKKKLTQDHVIPVSKGGEHTASNIIPLCKSCNSSKGNRKVNKVFQPHLYMV